MNPDHRAAIEIAVELERASLGSLSTLDQHAAKMRIRRLLLFRGGALPAKMKTRVWQIRQEIKNARPSER